MQTQSFGGSSYFITFTDDHSRYCRTYFLKKKSEALQKFKEFKVAVKKETGMNIKALRSDRGDEYMSEKFKQFLKENGIRSESTAAYSPQQNGVSERLNRTLVEVARSMISHAGLSKTYWAESVATTTYLHNQMVLAAIKSGITPYQLWYGKKPNLKHLQVFGCTVYSHIPDEEWKKLDKRPRNYDSLITLKQQITTRSGMKVNRNVMFVTMLSLTKVTSKPVQKHLSKNQKV